jgi:hypothetical protein
MISSFLLRHKKGIQPSVFVHQKEVHQELLQSSRIKSAESQFRKYQPSDHKKKNQPSVHQKLYQPNVHLERNKLRVSSAKYLPRRVSAKY